MRPWSRHCTNDPGPPRGQRSQAPSLLVRLGLLAATLLALTAPPFARAAGDGAPGRVGAAFGDGAAAPWADPFPAEAFQEKLPGACPALLDHRIADLRGRTINLCAFSGKVLLVVNTASR